MIMTTITNGKKKMKKKYFQRFFDSNVYFVSLFPQMSTYRFQQQPNYLLTENVQPVRTPLQEYFDWVCEIASTFDAESQLELKRVINNTLFDLDYYNAGRNRVERQVDTNREPPPLIPIGSSANGNGQNDNTSTILINYVDF